MSSYDTWKATNPDDEFLGPEYCERCNGTGEVVIDCGTLRYRGPGPVPEYARGVVGMECDSCGGSGVAGGGDAHEEESP